LSARSIALLIVSGTLLTKSRIVEVTSSIVSLVRLPAGAGAGASGPPAGRGGS
jgi:hypothetical protein